MPDHHIRRLIFLLFLISGACGLIYQVVWTRMMTLIFGVTVYAVSTVLCSFMAGLALGSVSLGRLADRMKRPIMLYGYLEIGIGVFALLFPFIMDMIEPLFVGIYQKYYEQSYAMFSFIRFLIIFPILLIPTFMMGGTFPIVSRYFVRGSGSLGKDVGTLYAINTTGAVLGTFSVGFIFLAFLGMSQTIILAAVLNIVVGIVSLYIGREAMVNLDSEEPLMDTAHEAGPHAIDAAANLDTNPEPNYGTSARQKIWLVLVAIGLSGFCSLGLEVLWTRVLVFHTHNSTYAFSSMLIAFLLGIALGGAAFGWVGPRVKHPFTLFALLELGIGVWTIFSLWLIGRVPGITEWLAQTLPFNNWFEIIILILSQSLVVLLVPAFMMGMTFPLATRLVTTSMHELGRKIGDVYGANTFGTVLGSFAVGFLLIPLLGVRNSFVLLAALNALVALALLIGVDELMKPLRIAGAAVCLVFIVAAQIVVPNEAIKEDFSRALGEIKFYKEGITDTIMVIDLFADQVNKAEPDENFRMLVFADGRGTAGHNTVAEDRFYAHLPMLLHENPEDVLVICVGAGNTIGAFAQHDTLEHLDAVELSGGVVEASEWFETNTGVLQKDDPRINVNVEDGRNYLLGTDKQYDIIHLDPPELHTAGIVFLYTEEFYELVKARMKPGAVFSHWFNATKLTDSELKMIVGTFQKVFPHGTIWQGPGVYSWNLIAKNEPLDIPIRHAVDTINEDLEVQKNLAAVQLENPYRLFSHLMMNEESLRDYVGDAPTLTDNKTRIDFSNPRSPYSGFGLVNIFGSVDGRLIFNPPDPNAPPPDPDEFEGGGWKSIIELGLQSDNALDLFDWTGMSYAEKHEANVEVNKYLTERRDIMKKYYTDFFPMLDHPRLGAD